MHYIPKLWHLCKYLNILIYYGNQFPLHQPNSQQFISEMKRQNGGDYDSNYTQADYDVYNRVLLSQLNSVIEREESHNMTDIDQQNRSAFAQTLIASTIKTSYGTTITTVYRGFADGYAPQEPSGNNGFGWDTIMCITAFIMNDSSTVVTTDEFYDYLAFIQCCNGDLNRNPTPKDIEAMKLRYPIEGKTIAGLDKDIVPLYKPRFFASIQFLSMIASLTRNLPFDKDLIIKYNSLREKELRDQTTRRLAVAVNLAHQMNQGTIAVERGTLVQRKKIDVANLF